MNGQVEKRMGVFLLPWMVIKRGECCGCGSSEATTMSFKEAKQRYKPAIASYCSYSRKDIPERWRKEKKRAHSGIAGELRKHLPPANKPELSFGAGLWIADHRAKGG